MRLSFVLGETNDWSLSRRLLSLAITATLKPWHTHSRYYINLLCRQTEPSPLTHTHRVIPFTWKWTFTNRPTLSKSVYQGHQRGKHHRAADGTFLLNSSSKAMDVHGKSQTSALSSHAASCTVSSAGSCRGSRSQWIRQIDCSFGTETASKQGWR